jgi:hypothetical protein
VSVKVICSYELQAFNKSNYQFKPHVWSLTHDAIYLHSLERGAMGHYLHDKGIKSFASGVVLAIRFGVFSDILEG